MNLPSRAFSTIDAAGLLPILALPGTLCDARVFAPFAPVWHRRSVIHGDITGLSSTAALADRLLREAPPRLILVGFSLGGIVALEIVARAPERVAAMVLIASNARDVAPDMHPARRASVADVGPGELVGSRLWPMSVHADKQGDERLRGLIVAMAEACPPHTAGLQAEVALSRVDSRMRLASLAMPVLILSGADDAIAPPEFQYEMAERLADAQLVLLPSAGHFAPLEQPDAAASAMGAWLARIAQSLNEQPTREWETP